MRVHRLPLLAVLLVVASIDCSDMGDPVELASSCDRSTGTLEFGALDLGRVEHRTLVITNSGNDGLPCSIGLDDPNFSVLNGGGNVVIPPGQSHSVVVRFSPVALGAHDVAMELGDGCPPVQLTGTGTPPPPGAHCQIVPDVVGFGVVDMETFADVVVEIRSVGQDPLDVDVVITGSAAFEVISGGGPATLQSGEIDTVVVRFAPTVTGNAAAILSFGSTCGSIDVTGTGVLPATVSFALHIQPIFNTRCVVCHGQDPRQGGLDLRSPQSYANLVNRTSVGYAPNVRISPGSLSSSVLYGKITGTNFGEQMPPGFFLIPQADRDRIETWILEGARNN